MTEKDLEEKIKVISSQFFKKMSSAVFKVANECFILGVDYGRKITKETAGLKADFPLTKDTKLDTKVEEK